MKVLMIEPLPDRGLKVGIVTARGWISEKIVAHAEDAVTALAGLRIKSASIDWIIIRSGIGSFSASRTAIVAGSALSAIFQKPLGVTNESVVTTNDLSRISIQEISAFDYASAPHITIKKQ